MKYLILVMAVLFNVVGCSTINDYPKDELEKYRTCYDQAHKNKNYINTNIDGNQIKVRLLHEEDYVKICMADKGAKR